MFEKAEDYPDVIKQAWVCWEVLRELGFTADDIYIGLAADDAAVKEPVIRVELRTQGKTFAMHTATLAVPGDWFTEAWREFTDRLTGNSTYSKFEKQELLAIRDSLMRGASMARLPEVLLRKGIVPPIMKDASPPPISWEDGKRSIGETLTSHAEEVAEVAKRMIEGRIPATGNVILIVEHTFKDFDVIRDALAIPKHRDHGVIVTLVDRATTATMMGRVAVEIPSNFFAVTESAGAMPVIMCAEEGVAFSTLIVNPPKPSPDAN